ncbi:MAG: right-handed parallel beta-helix repeat-containing protein [Candidatus Hydrogenedentes bacterium]|nr:right-handed parallel beta-helix repeat-containing protein [Candidatus Hydrogenedentota bacterium]
MKMRLHVLILAALGFCTYASSSSAATYYVKAGASGSGTSWAEATGNLQGAIESCAASGGGEVWVAAGTYTPATAPNGGSSPREVHFSLRSGVRVYGGFPATGTPSFSMRDPATYVTTCSGDIGTLEDVRDNTFHVFYHPGTVTIDHTAVLDGVRIAFGNANGDSVHAGGSGMFNSLCSPVLTNCWFDRNQGGGSALLSSVGGPAHLVANCRFTDNVSTSSAGAVYASTHSWSEESLTMVDCVFSNNTSLYGAGLYAYRALGVVLKRCQFKNNSAAYAGGGLYAFFSDLTLVSCVFDGNTAGNSGGGIFATHSRVTAVNCILFANAATHFHGGGASFANENEVSFINCTLCGNTSLQEGGGIEFDEGSINLKNTILRYNHSDYTAFHDLYMESDALASVDYCDTIYNGRPCRGTGNITNSVQFILYDNPRGADGQWLTADDGLRLTSASPCRDSGDNDSIPVDATDLDNDGYTLEPLPLDALGNLRIHGGDIDMGAYEYGSVAQPSYSVDFVLGVHGVRVGGGALHQEVVMDHPAEAPLVACLDGWSFTGWDADFSRVTGDMTVHALYSLNTHEVIFDLGAHATRVGGGSLIQNVAHGTAAIAPMIRVDVGWYFLGWDAAFNPVTAALTVHALYQEISIPGEIAYVKAGATGNGSSWAQAMGDLQAAIDYLGDAGTGQVWVASGTYYPNSWPHGGYTERTMHFTLRNNVRIYGGFPATGSPGMGERNWVAHPTICSGDLGALYDFSDNAYHVFFTRSLDTALLDGFVIEWGSADALESPHNAGGGMRNEQGSPTIIRCAFGENRARFGGGVYCKYSVSPTFTECRFSDNTAMNKGGGMRNSSGARPVLSDCVFHSNEADFGGGMANDLSSPRMKRCTFDHNTATDYGGGMHNAGGMPDLASCLFEQNEAADGGGMYNESLAWPWLANAIFFNNSAAFSGGAMYNTSGAEPILWFCTVAGNSAGNGGGLFSWSAAPTLYNSILWNNAGGSFVNLSSDPTAEHCIIQGGFAAGTVILDEDPAFANAADPNGADNEWFTADDGFRLLASSPALNRGENGRVPADFRDLDEDGDSVEALPLDAAGAARQVGIIVDMGAYEYPALVTHTVTFDPGAHGTRSGGGALVQVVEHHGAATAPILVTDIGWVFTGWDAAFDDVTANLTVHAEYDFAFEAGDICYVRKGGDGNGTSWDEAAGDLQGAIEVMASIGGGQVWVGAAEYLPGGHPNGGSGERQQHFALRNGVTVLGGFEAEGNPGLVDRDPAAFPTLLSGGLGAPGDDADNAYHVFYHPSAAALGATAVLDGFTIAGGRADGSAPHNSGGGMYNASCSPTLRRCTFSDNYALRGGGMYNLSSSPRLTRCAFEDNSAGEGGGMRNYTASSPSLADCIFRDNAATDGGAMHNHSSSPSLFNCVLTGNAATEEGGAMYNSASAPLVHLSTLYANEAGTTGGGIYNTSSSGPGIQNGILWGNTAPAGSNLYDSATSDSMVGYSVVGGGWAEGHDIVDADPLFADADLRLSTASPAINAGGNGSLPPDSHDLDGDGNTSETLPTDLGENTRVVDGTVDPGAYEYETAVHTVTFDLGSHGTRTGGGDLVQRIAYGEAAGAPEFDTEEGWAFTRWDHAFDVVTEDMLVTAQYEFLTFDVTFDLGGHGARVGGGELSQVIGYGGAAVAPLLTVADHWYFTGWSVAFDEVTSDLDVAAVYSQVLPSGGICYVKQGGTENGSSWDKAMGDLQAAINAIRLLGGGQVWVAAGTYRPNSWPHGGTGDVRAMHFALANGVTVYGGFPATGNPGLAQRAPAANISLCSGDLGAAGEPADNAYHVFYHEFGAALDDSAVLDGFAIRHGRANGAFPRDSGGGMLNRASSPILRNCAFSENAASWGGGMQNINSSSPRLEGCSFVNNQATWGGGIGNQGSSSPAIYDSTFRSNLASRGGALYSFQAEYQSVADCAFEHNQATENGGALYLDGACGIVSRCEIRGNHAVHGGGVVLAGNSRLFCSLVTGNSSTMSGAGVYLSTTGRIEYCTIAANVSGKHGGGLCMEGHGAVLASIVHGNTAAAEGPNCHDASALGTYDHCCTTPDVAGAGLVTDPPAFAAPAAGNFRLAAGSPCVDAGPMGADITTDLDGRPRPLDGDADGASVIDIGAYEFLNEDGDSDGDTMRDGWELEHALDLLDPSDALENPDKDPFTNVQEAVADTDPFDPGSYLRITMLLFHPEPTLYYWPASHRRAYTVCTSTNLHANAWADEPAATRVRPPASGVHSIHLWGREGESNGECYRIRVTYP